MRDLGIESLGSDVEDYGQPFFESNLLNFEVTIQEVELAAKRSDLGS